MKVDLSIIIVNYNVKDFLENALRSIEKAIEGISAEVFVVDNASEDGSVEMVKQKFPWVKVIASITFCKSTAGVYLFSVVISILNLSQLFL